MTRTVSVGGNGVEKEWRFAKKNGALLEYARIDSCFGSVVSCLRLLYDCIEWLVICIESSDDLLFTNGCDGTMQNDNKEGLRTNRPDIV